MDECRRRRLAVTAGDGDDSAGIPFPEQIHLAGERNTGVFGDAEEQTIFRYGGTDNDEIRLAEVRFLVTSQSQSDRPGWVNLRE